MKRIIHIILLLLFSDVLFSQTNELDGQYTPSSNSIFNADPNSKNSSNKPNHPGVKNMVKFIPTMLFRQKVALFYEREIVKSISVFVGAGKAFGEDVFQKTYLETFASLNYSSSYLLPEDLLGNSKFTYSTPLLAAGIRAYLSEHAFEDSFVELYYRNEKFSYRLNDTYVKDMNYISSDKTIDFKMHAVAFGYGFSSVFGEKNNFSHEMFFTFGIKFFYYDEIIRKDVYTVGYGSTQVYEKTGSFMQAKILPSVSFGYAFGFGF